MVRAVESSNSTATGGMRMLFDIVPTLDPAYCFDYLKALFLISRSTDHGMRKRMTDTVHAEVCDGAFRVDRRVSRSKRFNVAHVNPMGPMSKDSSRQATRPSNATLLKHHV